MAFDPRKLTVKAGEAIQRAQELAEQKQQRILEQDRQIREAKVGLGPWRLTMS